MQKKIVVGLGGVVVMCVVGSALLLQRLRIVRENEQSKEAALKAETAARTEQERRAEELGREQARLGRQNEELASLAQSLRASEARQSSNAAVLAQQLSTLATNATGAERSSDAPDANAKNPMAAMMEKMMKDPAVREMMRNQQKGMMQQMYGPLFKELALTPDEKQKFTDLLLDNAMKAAEHAGAMFKGEGPERSEALKTIGDQQKETSAGLKALLGEERFAQYEGYQKTVGDRLQLNQFKQQLDGSGAALQEAQYAQLLQIIGEEKKRSPPVLSDDPGRSAEALKLLSSEEAMTRQFQWQEELNKRVLERAGNVLTADQVKEFTDFQSQQLNLQKVAMTMARGMFGGDSAKGTEKIEVAPSPVPAK